MTSKNDQRDVRLHAVRITDFKRLEAVEFGVNDAGITIIAGDNAQGKSSALDGVWACLGGKKASPSEPVRRGARRAESHLDLGPYTVTRTYSDSGSTQLQVRRKDGGKVAKAQTFLDDLHRGVCADLSVFLGQDTREQAEALRQAVGIDTSDLDAQRAAAYDERTEVNRQVKQAQAEVDANPFDPDAPSEVVSARDLLNQVQEAAMARQAKAKAEAAVDDASNRLRVAQESLARAEKHLTECQAAVASAVAPDESEYLALQSRLAGLEEANELARKNLQRKEAQDKLQAAQAVSDGLTAQLADLDAAKAKMLQEATYPIDGLRLTDDGIRYKGVPLDQASQAERLEVAVAVALARGPELRLILVRDGSLLDDKHLQHLHALAVKHDAQVLLERVGDRDDHAIIIEDGRVRQQ